MAIQFSDDSWDAAFDAIYTEAGTGTILKIRSGSLPATCATADAGTVLSTINLPNPSMAASSGGTKSKTGTWEDATADATGTAAHFRKYKSDGTTCFAQGTVTITGGGGDMTVDSTSFTAGQSFTITGYDLNKPTGG